MDSVCPCSLPGIAGPTGRGDYDPLDVWFFPSLSKIESDNICTRVAKEAVGENVYHLGIM